MSIVRRAALDAAISIVVALVALASIAAMPGARAWAADASGGLSTREPEPSAEPTTEPTAPAGRAIIVRGAVFPADAPTAVIARHREGY